MAFFIFKERMNNLRKMKFNKYIFAGAAMGSFISAVVMPNIILAMPWDSKFQQIYNSLTGPVATCVSGIIFLATGAMIASSEGGGVARRGLQIVFGLTFILGAAGMVEFFRS